MNEINKVTCKSYLGAKIKRKYEDDFSVILAIKPYKNTFIFCILQNFYLNWVTQETLEREYEFI